MYKNDSIISKLIREAIWEKDAKDKEIKYIKHKFSYYY